MNFYSAQSIAIFDLPFGDFLATSFFLFGLLSFSFSLLACAPLADVIAPASLGHRPSVARAQKKETDVQRKNPLDLELFCLLPLSLGGPMNDESMLDIGPKGLDVRAWRSHVSRQ